MLGKSVSDPTQLSPQGQQGGFFQMKYQESYRFEYEDYEALRDGKYRDYGKWWLVQILYNIDCDDAVIQATAAKGKKFLAKLLVEEFEKFCDECEKEGDVA